MRPSDLVYVNPSTALFDSSYDIYPNRTGDAKKVLAGIDVAYIIEGVQERRQGAYSALNFGRSSSPEVSIIDISQPNELSRSRIGISTKRKTSARRWDRESEAR